ncbi:hypothetical protein GCM10010211_61160 [Streptomyces albospinus]|uniref:Uncharacterized protein n=1 Tax=Streptomyces albospinus TaxID=285515 RepID=A0ABQ2VJH6_9ACTN|nr:hypothetical protein GCM10010211_61160 [Streptomyces albospinus]
MPRESELSGKYAPPPEYAAQGPFPVAASVLGVVAGVAGTLAAEDARALRARSWNCRRCPASFLITPGQWGDAATPRT